MSTTVNGLALTNLTGFSPGIAADEPGINIKTFKVSVEPEFRNKMPARNGVTRGIIQAPAMSTVTIAGEVTGSTGIMAVVPGTAYTPANSIAYFGAPSTSLNFVKGDVEASREPGACLSMSAEFEALSGIP